MMGELICPACHETIGSRVAWCAACEAWWEAVKSGYCMMASATLPFREPFYTVAEAIGVAADIVRAELTAEDLVKLGMSVEEVAALILGIQSEACWRKR